MPIKKSDLYASIWKSCDELRGGMDASLYKDYVLTILFLKYVSDKYASNPNALLEIPDGSTFEDMVSLKGNPEIGDKINKEIIAPIAEANDLKGVIDQTDFNDDDKLGSGKEKVKRLSNLIGIFQDAKLDFKGNRAGDDDLLGDAYEYLMRNFATESGKSKGQFYTPAEVSRILSKVIGVENANSPSLTAYDPTVGSGSLLLKVADEAPAKITIYGQEMDVATAALAKMNMVLHNRPEAVHDIKRGNTLANPLFLENGMLKRFDYIVANPPFSYKAWANGIEPENDAYGRFEGYGIPPSKNGDYAFLLHIVRSLKNTGTAAIILPHGVLFRGNAEGSIRENLIKEGLIKAIIGLPPNLFYGTGIPACIVILDKKEAKNRDGIFMIDASSGFLKDGNKNRLREQDIHKIVDVFKGVKEVPGYSKYVPNDEIEKNEFNLNIPRYIDKIDDEDIQDIEGHLKGGIPEADVNGMEEFWNVYPSMKDTLFKKLRKGYYTLKIDKDEINSTIFSHQEFKDYRNTLDSVFSSWVKNNENSLLSVGSETHPKEFIKVIADDLLERYRGKNLIDPYDIYQHLLDYWNETMRDDVYMIVEDGWKATLEQVKDSKGKPKKGEFICHLIPKNLVISEYFSNEKKELDKLNQKVEESTQIMDELTEEHSGDEGLLTEAISDAGNVTKGNLDKRMKEIKGDDEFADEYEVLERYLDAYNSEKKAKSEFKKSSKELDALVMEKYSELNETEIKKLVVEDKWITDIKSSIDSEIDSISRKLTQRVNELANRYRESLTDLESTVSNLEDKVSKHLEKMGFTEWK